MGKQKMYLFAKLLSRNILTVLIIVSILSNTIVVAQAKPETVGKSILVMETTTNSIIYSKAADERMYPASTTKMLTALVVLDYFSVNDIITMGQEVTGLPPGSSLAGVGVGESLTIRNALIGMLLSSGNDVACSLALNVVQKKENRSDIPYAEAEKSFADIMNQKAKLLGATNSSFINPHGYHDTNHYSTATDLYLIAKAVLANPDLNEIVKLPSFRGDGVDKKTNVGRTIKSYDWPNSNRLISSNTYKYEYATGIKTGSTDEAGKCLIASAEKEGKKLIAVILNSDEAGRWNDAISLFNYGFDNFRVTSLQKKGEVIDKVLTMGDKNIDNKTQNSISIDIIADSDIESYIPSDTLYTIDKEVTYKDEINMSAQGQPPRLILPLKQGQVIGTVSYRIGEDVIYKAEIKAPSDKSINLTENEKNYKLALKKITGKKIFKFISKTLIVLLILVVLLMTIRIINIRIRRKRRKMRMRRKRRQNMRK